ncbi:MAG: HDIG domain-containing protein [Planctomycetaceae bacterium]|nr:HDIG domain-containing protein [Planctomycetaceae bacterium]
MFGLGGKKHRVSSSVARRAPVTVVSKLRACLCDRELMRKVALTAFALILLTVALQSWRAPFPYREGDVLPHGVATRVDFERVDEDETARDRDRAELAVPLIFRNDPSVLDPLPQELESALGEIAQAMSISDLSISTRKDFGLVPLEAGDSARLRLAASRFGAEDAQKRFQDLRAAVVGPNMEMANTQIVEMVADFTKFISPMINVGVIDPDVVRKQGLDPRNFDDIENGRYLLVLRDDTPAAEGNRVLLPQVRVENQLNEAGVLGKSWLSYPSLKQEIRPALSYWIVAHAQPTLRYDQVATKESIAEVREAVPNAIQRFLVGDLLIRPGERLDAGKLDLLVDEYNQMESSIPLHSRLTRVGIIFLLLVALAGVNGFYIVRNEPRLFECTDHLAVYLGAIVATAFVAHMASFDPFRLEMIPILFSVLLLSIAYNQVLAALTAFSLCLVLTLSGSGRLDHFIVLISTCSLAIIPMDKVASRLTLLKVSFISAVTYFFMQMGAHVVGAQLLTDVFTNAPLLILSAKGALYCLIACVLAAACLPFIESTFGIITDMNLRELGDAHPLLQDLIRLAPGTYNHSQQVAVIAETAAEQIGGNGLLVRVGAYFHDIGKMLKPNYFVENQQGDCGSPHEHLNPAMSTLIIIGHVKDGVDLAEQYHLPQQIIDFIEQHHGTTLVEYFYREATKLVEGQPDRKSDAEEASFRYPGPRPRTKEAAVLMIVDACESASRTLTEPTPKRLETLVHNIVMRRLTDGQFDECTLTMKELRTIEESVVKSLIGIYHGRIRYPDAKEPREPQRQPNPAETGSYAVVQQAEAKPADVRN